MKFLHVHHTFSHTSSHLFTFFLIKNHKTSVLPTSIQQLCSIRSWYPTSSDHLLETFESSFGPPIERSCTGTLRIHVEMQAGGYLLSTFKMLFPSCNESSPGHLPTPDEATFVGIKIQVSSFAVREMGALVKIVNIWWCKNTISILNEFYLVLDMITQHHARCTNSRLVYPDYTPQWVRLILSLIRRMRCCSNRFCRI